MTTIDARFKGEYDQIPARMRVALVNWVDHGQVPGDFLQAVIRNDLRNAVLRADQENLLLLPLYLHWFYWEAPLGCYGGPEAFNTWANKGAKETFR